MDCGTAREWLASTVAEELEPSETVQVHLSQCPSCRAEYEEWRRTWALLAAWADTEPPSRLDRAVLAEVSAATETRRSWIRQLATGRIWATAAAAAVLAITASLLLPYQDSLRLCGKVLADAGFSVPALPLSFLVGLPYAVLPLLLTLLPWMYLQSNGHKMQGLLVGQVFAVIMVPYVLFVCVDVEATVIAGVLLGTAIGALLGGAISQWLAGLRPAGAPA